MALSVFIPAVLRPFSGGAESVEVPPTATLGAALEALFARHPGLRDRVLTETGEIRRHVNVFVGAERCRDLAAPLPPDAELAILPAVSGGAGMRTLRVDMDAIVDAMTATQEDPTQYLLDRDKGTVVPLLAEDEDEDDEELGADVPIPRLEARWGYDLMCRFAATIDEEDIHERLDLALRGKGAFGRFRDVVFRYPDLKDRWFAMHEDAVVAEARRWLASLGIEPIFEPRKIEEAPAASAPAPPKIDLLDLVLLGAPDGKTELIDGQVLRRMTLPTQAEARAVFKSLARQLCSYVGMEWRNRFIEGKTEFETGRAHLRLEGTTIELRIDVPLASWKAFS